MRSSFSLVPRSITPHTYSLPNSAVFVLHAKQFASNKLQLNKSTGKGTCEEKQLSYSKWLLIVLGIVLVYKYPRERHPIGWFGQQVTPAYTLITPLLLALLIAYI